jgi:glycosyltransferase involved in cell wall biosynthesis
MKIAYMLGSLNRGGTENLLLDYFRSSAQAEFPFIGIYRKEGQMSDAFQNTTVPLFKLFPKHRLDISYLFQLRKLIKQQGITTIHAQQSLDALYAHLACLGMKVKIVLTLHGYDVDLSKMDIGILRLAMQMADVILFVSNTQKAYYQQTYSLATNKTRTLYNGISFEKLDIAEQTDIRLELQLSTNILLLGSVGNFVAVRDQMTLCRFLKRLHEANVDFRFLFVGAKSKSEPERYDDCVQFCHDNGLNSYVLFLGSRNDVPAILHQLDAFLYASDHDTFGIAVIEAMASSVPVFVNDWEVMREITDDGHYATLYKTKQEDDLWRRVNDFLSNSESYKKKAKQAAAWARQQYSIQSHLKQLKAIYMEVSN